MNKKKKIILPVITGLLMIMTVVGVTYAFFNYTRTGSANILSVGRISFNHTQDGRINLSDVFPIDKSTINTDTKNVGTFEINIEGDTDYVGGIEYLVSAVNTNMTTSTGQIVPISLDISVEGLGTYNNNYFTERENKNSKIYKRLTGNGIMGDGNLLVGYIPQNTTLGTSSGIDGKITIKAYIDQDKVAISDTYDGNETDLMGTTNEWVGDRVVLTTDEWNAFQDSGISFQIKVEANEDIWVEETLYDIVERQTVMDNINSTYVNNTTPGIDFSKISGDTDNDGVIDNGEGVYTLSSSANDAYPIMYYRGAVTNNNVFFANKCWQIIRTTDTGGVKMIYNGENTGTVDAPACENTTGASRQITLNIGGTDTNTFSFSGTNLYDSPAYNGYMYGTVYSVTNGAYTDGAYFGNSFTYDETNDVYTLVNAKAGIDETHHYTCNETSASGTCASIRYYFTYFTVSGTMSGTNYYLYFTLADGKSIEDALEEMQTNTTSSNAKDKIDMWYTANIGNNVSYAQMLEDTIFCNDRRISTLGGLNPNGGVLTSSGSAYYAGYARAYTTYSPSLSCRKNDAFTLPNGRGNGALANPVGLITSDEIMLAGGKTGTANGTFYLKSGANYWSSAPLDFAANGIAIELYVRSAGRVDGNAASLAPGLRPSISLKNSTVIVANDADGTVSNPYIIK